jgi:hypothetical protein
MAAVTKIDSNVTETRFTEETSFGEVSGSDVWKPLEPNSFSEAGAKFTKVARNPIAGDRQRRKAITVDQDVQFGFNSDLTQYLQELFQGFFFADFRTKTEFGGSGQLLTVNGSNQFTAASGLGVFAANDLVMLRGGDLSLGNTNRLLRVTASAATTVTVAETLVAETLPSGAKLVKVGVQTAAGDIDVDASGALPALTSTTLDFTTLGLVEGEYIWIGGDSSGLRFAVNAVNNCLARVDTIAANRLTLNKCSKGAMITETQAGQTVQIFFGRVLKNETTSSLIQRRTYQFERTLGAPDDASLSQIQSQYFTGAVANELTFNLKGADKITCDLKFVCGDQETRSGVTGVKAGTRPDIENAQAQNTSSDLKRVRLAAITQGNEAPTPLVAFIPEMTVTINNGVEPNKALATFGAFDMSAGDFSVSASMTGYFADIASIAAVENNSDVTLDVYEFSQNSGWVMDFPLLSLGDGSVQIVKDKPVMLPLSSDAASGIEAGFADHTLLMVFYDYLPTLAGSPNE